MYLFPVALLTACDRVAEEQYRHVVSKAGTASISNHSDKYRCLMRIRQVHGEYSVEHSMERYVVGVVDFSFDYGRDRRRDHRAEYHGEFRVTAQRRGHDFGNDLFR